MARAARVRARRLRRARRVLRVGRAPRGARGGRRARRRLRVPRFAAVAVPGQRDGRVPRPHRRRRRGRPRAGRGGDPRGPLVVARRPAGGGRQPSSCCPAAPRSPGRSSSTGTAGGSRATGDATREALLDALDEQQRAAAEALTGSVCVLAGAGTGKTRTITHRIAYGVATGVFPPKRVMALTFTTRAAGGAARSPRRARRAGHRGADVPLGRARAAEPLLAAADGLAGAVDPRREGAPGRQGGRRPPDAARLGGAEGRGGGDRVPQDRRDELRALRRGRRRPGAAGGVRHRRDGRAAAAVRDGEGRAADARLRGRAARDGRDDRVGAGGRDRGAGAVPLLHGRRVPGRLARAAGAARGVARRPHRRLRRRRREPDDLLVRGRAVRLPPPLRRAARRERRAARAQLPVGRRRRAGGERADDRASRGADAERGAAQRPTRGSLR